MDVEKIMLNPMVQTIWKSDVQFSEENQKTADKCKHFIVPFVSSFLIFLGEPYIRFLIRLHH